MKNILWFVLLVISPCVLLIICVVFTIDFNFLPQGICQSSIHNHCFVIIILRFENTVYETNKWNILQSLWSLSYTFKDTFLSWGGGWYCGIFTQLLRKPVSKWTGQVFLWNDVQLKESILMALGGILFSSAVITTRK